MSETDFVVDDEFEKLLDSPEQWRDSILLDDLLERGVLDSLKVWDETNILLDGHRRHHLCKTEPRIVQQHGVPKVMRLSFESRTAAKAWVVGYQNGRRNCSKVAQAITAGLTVEDKRGGDRRSKESTLERSNVEPMQSAERFKRHADKQAAEGWQAVADVSPEAGRAILSDDDTPVTQKDLRDVAKAEGNAKAAIATQVADKALKKPHVAQNSGENEWYTPADYIEAARLVMGEITLDPASSEKANETVKAACFFTKDDDGLSQIWEHPALDGIRRKHGERAADDAMLDNCLWMNPPYAQPLMSQFADKLCEEWGEGRIAHACVLVNNATETRWFQALANEASAICFPSGRVKFIDQHGNPGAPLQGQAVLYLGDKVNTFARHFSRFGFIARVD